MNYAVVAFAIGGAKMLEHRFERPNYQATADSEFLPEHGAEMMLEIARFWASIAHYNPERDRYEIHGVMGPDEFHERYPGAEEAGLRNNAYTNLMVAWIAGTAPRVLNLLPRSRRATLRDRLGLTDDELRTWDEMSRKMFIPFHAEGIISQFEGYADLEELDWDRYRAEHPNIQRLDRILKAAGDDPNRYQLAKQADTVMLFFLFSDDELRELFARLGYNYDPDLARRTIDYYDQRTSHGSTLSLVTHAAVLSGLDPESSWKRFLVALESDVGDVQGGTTKEGIHMGVMSGTLDLLQRSYVGASVGDGVLHIDPTLTDRLDGLTFPMQFRGTSIRVSISGDELTVHALTEGFSRSVRIGIGDEVRELAAGEEWVAPLRRAGTRLCWPSGRHGECRLRLDAGGDRRGPRTRGTRLPARAPHGRSRQRAGRPRARRPVERRAGPKFCRRRRQQFGCRCRHAPRRRSTGPGLAWRTALVFA